MRKRRIGLTISTVAKTYHVHPQTLRIYEREGLLKPSRSRGNTRLYTDADLQRLEVILTLTRELGVNLAGVDVILNMRERIERMQSQVEDLLKYLALQFNIDPETLRPSVREALIQVPPSKLVPVRKK
ncbi:MAG: MerR family transcriptional regulator [Acidobacteria bacterium]|nr:MerR family transcriptional regulator [Acidobacteriota bacterium]